MLTFHQLRFYHFRNAVWKRFEWCSCHAGSNRHVTFSQSRGRNRSQVSSYNFHQEVKSACVTSSEVWIQTQAFWLCLCRTHTHTHTTHAHTYKTERKKKEKRFPNTCIRSLRATTWRKRKARFCCNFGSNQFGSNPGYFLWWQTQWFVITFF